MDSEKQIGRSMERFKTGVDVVNLGASDIIEILHTFLDLSLEKAGYTRRQYDQCATAYFHNEPPRKEPIILEKWRIADLEFVKKVLSNRAGVAQSNDHIKFDKELDYIKPGNMMGLSIILRNCTNSTRFLIKTLLLEILGNGNLEDFEDRSEHRPYGPNTEKYSFVGRFPSMDDSIDA